MKGGFADDTIIFSVNVENLKAVIGELYDESVVVGLKMEIAKTNITCNNRHYSTVRESTIYGFSLTLSRE